MKLRVLSMLCCLSMSLVWLAAVQASGARAPIVRLKVGTQHIEVERAATPSTRQAGLMHRTHLAPDSGMLFEFEHPEIVCFWMKDTWIPLSIAFIAEGRIIDIQSMEPLSTDAHCSTTPVSQALEMNDGWFLQHDIQPGDTVTPLGSTHP